MRRTGLARDFSRKIMAEGLQLRGRQAFEDSDACATLQEALEYGRDGKSGGLLPEEFSLRDLAANTIFSRDGQPVGRSFLEEYLDPASAYPLQEAMSAVDSSMFAGITGQLMISRILQSFQAEEFIVSRLVPTYPTRMNGERVPGIYSAADPGEDVAVVKEGEEFRTIGFGETYVQTPGTVKRGFIIPLTKEAIFFDRTGLVLQKAGEVGEILGLRKEKNIIDVVIGAVNPYVEKLKTDSAATALSTFYSAVDAGRWINHFDGNALTDWTNIDYAEAAFADMTDPNTGEPILLPNTRLVLAPQIKFLAVNQLLQANAVWKLTQSDAVRTIGPNPLQNLNITLATSRQLRARLTAFAGSAATGGGYWFYGDIAKAFGYQENWPITVVQAPQNSEAEFMQDIVVRFKASERGSCAVMNPRAWQRHRTLATSSSSGV